MVFEIKKSSELDSQVYRDSLVIREDVFVREQGVSIELEIEGEEGPTYYCGYADGNYVSCARTKIEEDGAWHIQRVATLKNARGKDYASKVMKHIEQDARKQNVPYLTLDSQDQAQQFYSKLGYQVIGEGFIDADIPHHKMNKILQ